MQFCSEPGCHVLVARGHCATHTRHARSGATYAEVHRWYTSARWLRLRAAVLRDEPFCRVCRLEGRNVLTVDIDHMVRHAGDAARFWDRANLQGLCKAHHSEKTKRGA